MPWLLRGRRQLSIRARIIEIGKLRLAFSARSDNEAFRYFGHCHAYHAWWSRSGLGSEIGSEAGVKQVLSEAGSEAEGSG